jgi:hypothetical protein
MSTESIRFGQMVRFIIKFVAFYYPFLEFTSFTTTPEKTLFNDQESFDSFIESLRPPPFGGRQTLCEFFVFQLTKPIRTFGWLAAKFDGSEQMDIQTDSPNVAFSFSRNDQEIGLFMRSLHRRDALGEEIHLVSECPEESPVWLVLFAKLRDILQYDHFKYT